MQVHAHIHKYLPTIVKSLKFCLKFLNVTAKCSRHSNVVDETGVLELESQTSMLVNGSVSGDSAAGSKHRRIVREIWPNLSQHINCMPFPAVVHVFKAMTSLIHLTDSIMLPSSFVVGWTCVGVTVHTLVEVPPYTH